MQRDVRVLSWADFNHSVARLAAEVDRSRPGIYGVPRGGLVLAVALSHATGLPLLTEPQPWMVVVDDIVDSGKTAEHLRQHYPAAQIMSWVARIGDYGPYVITSFGEWWVFPWERADRAEEERRAYDLSRQ